MAGQLGPRITIGRLRHRVKIQVPDATRTKFGNEKPTWTDGDTVRAEVRAITGRELFASGQTQAQISHVVTMRWRAGVTAKYRLVWLDHGSTILNIVAVPPSVGTANTLQIHCLMEA